MSDEDPHEEFRHTGLVCCLLAITFDPGGRCVLHVPEHHCTDMSGAIKLAQRVTEKMPKFKLKVVEVLSGGRQDVIYRLVDGEWIAREFQ